MIGELDVEATYTGSLHKEHYLVKVIAVHLHFRILAKRQRSHRLGRLDDVRLVARRGKGRHAMRFDIPTFGVAKMKYSHPTREYVAQQSAKYCPTAIRWYVLEHDIRMY